MRVAILADIHSNWEALDTASRYLEGQTIDKIAVLGDIIGYGANPNECFEWVKARANVVVVGNHERALVDPRVRQWFTAEPLHSILWTERAIKPEYRKQFLNFPYIKVQDQMTFVHGSLSEPEDFGYLLEFSDTKASFELLENSICFTGHTHVPCCFREWMKSAEYLTEGIYPIESRERYILNPGSVGQPRDKDKRLSFGIFDDAKRTFEIVRLAYDSEKAAGKIRAAGLPAIFADRLR